MNAFGFRSEVFKQPGVLRRERGGRDNRYRDTFRYFPLIKPGEILPQLHVSSNTFFYLMWNLSAISVYNGGAAHYGIVVADCSLKYSQWKLWRCHRAQKHVGVLHMLIFKNQSALPPEVYTRELWFPRQTPVLTLPRILPPVCHYKETRTPTMSFLVLSGYHSDEVEKSPGCRFRFKFSCCRNTPLPNMGSAGLGWGLSPVKDLKNDKQ